MLGTIPDIPRQHSGGWGEVPWYVDGEKRSENESIVGRLVGMEQESREEREKSVKGGERDGDVESCVVW